MITLLIVSAIQKRFPPNTVAKRAVPVAKGDIKLSE